MRRKICCVVGGQFGSEGKGLVIGHVAKEYGHHVRVGAANAGHTVCTDFGGGGRVQKHVLQQIPCAAYANPEARLYVGPGALLSPGILIEEIRRNAEWRARHGHDPIRLMIDFRAHVITAEQVSAEQRTGLAERIGSTSTIAREGIGVAAADRLLRAERCEQVSWGVLRDGLLESLYGGTVEIGDVPMALHECVDSNPLLVEGTQGTGLSNATSRFFPYCTSRTVTAAGLLADSGLPPRADRVIMVCRTYPIRVAGPSGPFYEDGPEIRWEDIGVDRERERTTVTKKVRRVAEMSLDQIKEASALNGATEVALTFADYLDPTIASESGPWTLDDLFGNGHHRVADAVAVVEEAARRSVTMIGTGPASLMARATFA